MNTQLEITDLEILMAGSSGREIVNFAEVEGIVATTWRWGGDLYARLAMYDCHASTLPGTGKNGHPRRKPHYVTVVFPEGKISGRAIDLHERCRVRVRGAVLMRLYHETLREMLIRNADKIGQYRASRAAKYVLAASAQVFGKFAYIPEAAMRAG